MSFPWDLFALAPKFSEILDTHSQPTALVAPILYNHNIGHLFGTKNFWRFPKNIPATMENYEKLAEQGRNVLIYPEGIPGIAKGFHRKYKLQNFSSSSIRMSLKYGHALVPTYTINAEYINPYAYSLKPLNRITSKIGLPFYSLGWATIFVALFPATMYIALPAKLRFIIGKKINVASWTQKSYENLSDAEIREMTARVQHLMQAELDQLVIEHGKIKYGLGEFFSSLPKLGLKALLLIPFTWPFLLHSQLYKENRSLFGLLRSSYLCLALCLPVLGWPLFVAYLLLTKKPLKFTLPVETHEKVSSPSEDNESWAI
jgi:hypothetical protein